MKKTITLTNNQIYSLCNYLNSDQYALSKENVESRGGTVNTKISWAMLKNKKALYEIYNLFIEEKDNIDKDYMSPEKSDHIEEDDTYKIKPEFSDKYDEEINALLNADNDIELSMISIDDLAEYKLTETDIINLETFLEEEL